ncbi:uncharacterized protein B0H18DRAFT_1025770 [Fomitopsis serialis]|uniref:uncharacterized protein n=1 Tax=Fomitopsis serialis TaxID=139415 RepID=UPI0020085338|nr:uncharacterized protein B0H18DRAFT_1025770 [Neoantrodia serialis]KAH9920067.1 hypothetical protein B0H18DRAFT_1025770 [Neoantrodia serialis]
MERPIWTFWIKHACLLSPGLLHRSVYSVSCLLPSAPRLRISPSGPTSHCTASDRLSSNT